jgi:hypothetical protein
LLTGFISEQDLIETVAIIPEEWQFTMEERLVMLKYLKTRQDLLLDVLSSKILDFEEKSNG